MAKLPGASSNSSGATDEWGHLPVENTPLSAFPGPQSDDSAPHHTFLLSQSLIDAAAVYPST
jgi:hypothetical protein